tara:strand:+ start:152 stop:472 length:321 start_codon:yes stop_codon:yes gene_type:complete
MGAVTIAKKLTNFEQIKQLPEGEYRGECVNDQLTGHGVLTFKKGDRLGRVSYEGEFQNNQAHHGEYRFQDGRVYRGELKMINFTEREPGQVYYRETCMKGIGKMVG